MGKREKKKATGSEKRRESSVPGRAALPGGPKKRPVMLGVSVVLFVAWCLFLLGTVVWG